MSKPSIKSFLFTTFIFISGCATTYSLKPIINDANQEMVFNQGREVAISRGQETGIAITGHKTEKNELVFRVLYKNNSSKRINVIPESIRVQGFNQQNLTNNFKVYSAEEYLKKMKTAQTWAAIAEATAGAMEAYNAGTSTSTTYGTSSETTSGSIFGSDGTTYTGSATTYGSNTSTTTTQDYGKQAEANARNQANLEKTVANQQATYQATEQGLIKSHTLNPGLEIEGGVIVKLKSGYESKFIVTVPFGVETHTITFIPK